MKKVKIGKGYLQTGYGRGFKKNSIIWLINGKAYAKDSKNSPYQTDIKGYVMVNFIQGNFQYPFCQVGLISEHIFYKVN